MSEPPKALSAGAASGHLARSAASRKRAARKRPTYYQLAAAVSVAALAACQESRDATSREPPTASNLDRAPAHGAPTQAVVPQRRKARPRELDATFFVASDTHLGFGVPSAEGRSVVDTPTGIERTNLTMIHSMNEAPGRLYPPALGGAVGVPRGVLITGDLTEHGGAAEWAMFEEMYGRSGRGGPLKFPVYEADGNHDRAKDWYVRERIAERHGGRYYSFDWSGLHLVCLAEAPGDDGIDFLKTDLASLDDDVPVVLFMHYPLLGPYSETWWSEQDGPEKLKRAIGSHNVVAIFHGHHHATGAYRWEGMDVYHVGSPKNAHHTYLTVEVDTEQMLVAAYNYDTRAWWWWHEKPINEGTTQRRAWVIQAPSGAPQPVVEL